jgi:hypothetical protein
MPRTPRKKIQENERVKPAMLCLFVLMGCISLCHADPDLGHFQDMEGVRLYRDHQTSSEWYLSPSGPELGLRADGTPDYGLALYRYLGRSGTGDSGDFRIRGVLTLGMDRSRKPELTAKIRKALIAQGIPSPRLKSIPVSESLVNVVFADQQAAKTTATRWKTGSLVIFLDAALSQILWDAVEAGQTLVSLSLEETLKGVRKEEETWKPSTTSSSWVVPVDMDLKKHPDHFQKMDLGGRMKVGYTGLDVFCFDFIENLEEDLYAKIVEVSIPTAGRDLVETITFKADGEYRSRLDFKLAKDLDRPYRYRITRVKRDGTRETGPWQEKQGETLLDITAYNKSENSGEETVEPPTPEP